MTFDQIWGQLVRQKPKLERDDSIAEFTVANLRRLLRQVYEQGQASVPREPLEDTFAKFFGGSR